MFELRTALSEVANRLADGRIPRTHFSLSGWVPYDAPGRKRLKRGCIGFHAEAIMERKITDRELSWACHLLFPRDWYAVKPADAERAIRLFLVGDDRDPWRVE